MMGENPAIPALWITLLVSAIGLAASADRTFGAAREPTASVFLTLFLFAGGACFFALRAISASKHEVEAATAAQADRKVARKRIEDDVHAAVRGWVQSAASSRPIGVIEIRKIYDPAFSGHPGRYTAAGIFCEGSGAVGFLAEVDVPATLDDGASRVGQALLIAPNLAMTSDKVQVATSIGGKRLSLLDAVRQYYAEQVLYDIPES